MLTAAEGVRLGGVEILCLTKMNVTLCEVHHEYHDLLHEEESLTAKHHNNRGHHYHGMQVDCWVAALVRILFSTINC